MDTLTKAAVVLLVLNLLTLVGLYLLPMPDPAEIPGRDARTVVGQP